MIAATSSVRWASCRNVLMGLVGLQMLLLVYIGFSAPTVDHHGGLYYDQGVVVPPPVVKGGTTAAVATTRRAQEKGTSGSSQVWKADSNNNSNNKQPDVLPTMHLETQKRVATTEVNLDTTGPYDIPGAYFANFELYRQRPPVASHQQVPGDRLQEIAKTAEKVFSKKVTACTVYSSSDETGRQLLRPECRPSSNNVPLIAYNPSSTATKSWCGVAIAPQSYAEIPASSCHHGEPVRLGNAQQQQQAPLAAKDISTPVEFVRTDLGDKAPAPQRLDHVCDFPCSVTPCNSTSPEDTDCLPQTSEWTISNTDHWKFTYYHKVAGIKVDRKAYRNFVFSASQSFKADIPLSYFDWSRDAVGAPPPAIDFASAEKSVSLISTETCRGLIRAEAWALSMKQNFELASYGQCMHSADVPAGLDLGSPADRQVLLKKHLFALVVEDTIENDFITDLLWEALHAGVVPVYYGAGNILNHVPAGSIVSASALKNKDDTAKLLKEISTNETKWLEYHAWRNQPSYPAHLQEKYAFVQKHPYCRICEWAYAKQHGLGWNHVTQTLQPPKIDRSKTCLSDSFLVTPFRESWYSTSDDMKTSSGDEKTVCNTDTADDGVLTKTIQTKSFSVTRTLSPHDSVVDILLDRLTITTDDDEVVLRLNVPISNWEGAYFPNIHRVFSSPHHAVPFLSSIAIQDGASRMTVLVNNNNNNIHHPAVTLRTKAQHGMVEIVFSQQPSVDAASTSIMIRVILEDTSSLRDVQTEYRTSPFANPLIQDFMDPLDLFTVEES